jgi:hypothetical protein
LGATVPISPFSLSSTEFVEPPLNKVEPPAEHTSWVRHWTQYSHLKCKEQLALWHSVTFTKISTVINFVLIIFQFKTFKIVKHYINNTSVCCWISMHI